MQQTEGAPFVTISFFNTAEGNSAAFTCEEDHNMAAETPSNVILIRSITL